MAARRSSPYFVELHRLVDRDHQRRGQGRQQPGQQGDVAQAEGQGAAAVTPQLVVYGGLHKLAEQSGKREKTERKTPPKKKTIAVPYWSRK